MDGPRDTNVSRLFASGGALSVELVGRLNTALEADADEEEGVAYATRGRTAPEPLRLGRLARFERVMLEGDNLRFGGEPVFYDWHAQERQTPKQPLYLAFANLARNTDELAERVRRDTEHPDPSWADVNTQALAAFAQTWGPLGLRAYHLGTAALHEVEMPVTVRGRTLRRSSWLAVLGEPPYQSVRTFRRQEDAEAWLWRRKDRLAVALTAESLDDWRYALLVVHVLLELRRAGDRQRWVDFLNLQLAPVKVRLRQPDPVLTDERGRPVRTSPALWLEPPTLYHAVFVSFLVHATGQAKGELVYLKRCENRECGRWFTSTHPHARFCQYRTDSRGNSLCKNQALGRERYHTVSLPRKQLAQAVASSHWWTDPARRAQAVDALRSLRDDDSWKLPGFVKKAFVEYARSTGNGDLARRIERCEYVAELAALL